MRRKPRICIVTPAALGSNPRVIKEAEALQEYGNEVTVVSTRTLADVDQRDEAVLASASWRAHRLDFCARGGAWQLRRATQMGYALAFSITGSSGIAERGF